MALPLFELGFKEDMKPSAQSDMKTEAAMEVLLELLTSDASPLFRRLLDEGLINESSFSGERFEGSGFASVLFSGESTDPRRTAAEILEEVEKLQGIKNVYIFSWGDVGSFGSYFENLSGVNLKSIPQPILDIYKSLNA